MASYSPIPDIKNNPSAWFSHFSSNNNYGLTKQQVYNALNCTFPAIDSMTLQSFIDHTWPMIDPDRSGTVTFQEFMRPSGLREIILAQFSSSPTPSLAPFNQAVPVPSQYKCGMCRSTFNAIPPPGQSTFTVSCPLCTTINQIQAPILPPPPPQQQSISYSANPYYDQTLAYQGSSSMANSGLNAGMYGQPNITSGSRRALLIGINYFGTRAELRGCINDVNNLKSLLIDVYKWSPSCIRVLTDDDHGNMPTRANILAGLHWLADGMTKGDVLFLHFSGHGAQMEDPHGYEEDGMNETILPVDFKTGGMISDDEIASIVVRPLPNGSKLVAVMDCCHSGTGLDLPYEWQGQGGNWREETNPYHCAGDVQLFSGCADDQTSADISSAYAKSGGAMSTAFCDVLRSNPHLTYSELMGALHRRMRERGYSQHPTLSSTQRFPASRVFLLDDILMNSNTTLGRTFRRKFPPRPRPMDASMQEMLGLGVAVVGAMCCLDMLFSALFD